MTTNPKSQTPLPRKLTGLKQVAEHALDSLSPNCDDDAFYEMEAMAPEKIVRRFYTTSDCDLFSTVINHLTGWPVVAVSAPASGPLHRLNQAPDGRLVDAYGWTDLAKLAHRYAAEQISLAHLTAGSIDDAIYDDLDRDGFDHELEYAVVAVRHLPWAPFNRVRFQKMTARQVAGVDFPAPLAA